MKKIITILFSLLILVGCTQKGYSQLSNGDDVIFKGDDIEYKKSDLYKSLKISSDYIIEDDVLRKIATKLDVDIDALGNEADSELEMYQSYYDEATLMAYKEQLISDKILTKLSEIYLNENYTDFVSEDKPIKMQMASFSDESTANQFINDVNAGTDFQTAATNNGYQGDSSMKIYFDSDSIALNVKSYINSTATNGLSTIIVETSSSTDADGNTTETNTYYVVNIESRDVNEFVDEYKSAKLDKLGIDAVKEYMFSKYDVKFYDQDLYEIMYAKYEDLK